MPVRRSSCSYERHRHHKRNGPLRPDNGPLSSVTIYIYIYIYNYIYNYNYISIYIYIRISIYIYIRISIDSGRGIQGGGLRSAQKKGLPTRAECRQSQRG